VVSPGDPFGILTINGDFTQSQGTLLIDIAGVGTGEFSVLEVLGNVSLKGHLDPVLQNGFIPTVGESFTFLNYAAVGGILSIVDRNIDNAAEHWEITYQRTSAVLTVAPGNIAIPDWGSTALLSIVSLLALVIYRWVSRLFVRGSQLLPDRSILAIGALRHRVRV
jgi:hypothetical protein